MHQLFYGDPQLWTLRTHHLLLDLLLLGLIDQQTGFRSPGACFILLCPSLIIFPGAPLQILLLVNNLERQMKRSNVNSNLFGFDAQ